MSTQTTPVSTGRAGVEIPPPVHDPWRKTMGLNLRSEAAKFILTSFNLDVFSDQPPGSAVSLSQGATEKWFAQRFARFLSAQPEAHYGLDHRRFIVLRKVKAVIDVSLCEFAPDGSMRKLTPVFDERQPADPDNAEVRAAVHAVVSAFNSTRTMTERERPMRLRAIVGTSPLAGRLLASTVVSFEEAASRFQAPDMMKRRGFPESYMAAVCRRAPDARGADLWLQCHHAGSDGGPMQEMLDKLESAWGVTTPVQLPPDDPSRVSIPQLCHAPNERPTGLITDFIDFAPLADLRRELANNLAGQVESVPLGGLFMWCLAHQQEFGDVGMNTAADVPPMDDKPRAVDLITLWPGRYRNSPDGFLTFLRNLNSLIGKARLRKTETWGKLVQLTSVPAIMSCGILRFMENGTRGTFGTLTVSLVKGTKLVIAPMPDSAWDHGFIAVGNMGVPAESGPPVTPVSIKGAPDRIAGYPAAIRRAIANCRDYVK